MLTLLLLAQQTQPFDLAKATTLRPGEIVRFYKRGGLYQALIVATKARVFVKTLETSATYQLDRDQQVKLASAARASLPELKPRANPGFPSTYDGVDLYLSYRQHGKVVTWTNERYEMPKKPFPVVEFLNEFLPDSGSRSCLSRTRELEAVLESSERYACRRVPVAGSDSLRTGPR